MDLIERQAAIDALKRDEAYDEDIPNRADGVRDAIITIMGLPSAQPERKGKWIDMGDFEQCSVCTGTRLKEVQTVYGKAIWIKTNYCPSCGADMRGEDHDT